MIFYVDISYVKSLVWFLKDMTSSAEVYKNLSDNFKRLRASDIRGA